MFFSPLFAKKLSDNPALQVSNIQCLNSFFSLIATDQSSSFAEFKAGTIDKSRCLYSLNEDFYKSQGVFDIDKNFLIFLQKLYNNIILCDDRLVWKNMLEEVKKHQSSQSSHEEISIIETAMRKRGNDDQNIITFIVSSGRKVFSKGMQKKRPDFFKDNMTKKLYCENLALLAINSLIRSENLFFLLLLYKNNDNYLKQIGDPDGYIIQDNLFIFVQHADSYPKYQEKVLKVWLNMYEDGTFDDHHSVLDNLIDRVQIKKDNTQIYGSHFRCDENKNAYINPPLKHDLNQTNLLRFQLNLDPLQEEIYIFESLCKEYY